MTEASFPVKHPEHVVVSSTGIIRVPPRAGGAVESYVSDITQMLMNKGLRITLVSPVRDSRAFPGVEVIDVPTTFDTFPLKPVSSALAHIMGGVRTAHEVRRYFLSAEPGPGTILHMNEEISAALLLRSLPGVPKIFTMHNPPVLEDGNPTGRTDSVFRGVAGAVSRRLICRKADIVIVLSHYFKQYIHNYWQIPSERIRVLPLPIDTSRYRPSTSATHKGEEILYVGRFDQRKNVSSLVKAMRQVNHGTRLTLVGKGPLRENIAAYVRTHDLERRVRILSEVPLEELVKIYQQSDVFVLPTSLDTYGRVIVEAAASGLPVILPDLPIFQDFKSSGFVHFVRQAEPNLLARAIEELSVDQKTRNIMSQRARAFAVNNNGYEQFVDRLTAIYREAAT